VRIVRGGYDLSQPWPESLYHEALIIMQAEAGYQVTSDEIDEEAAKRRQQMATTGFVAGRAFEFWSKFIIDGQLDEERAMSEGGLTEEQLPEKLREMVDLGWLETPDHADTAPLEQPEAQVEDEEE
jgi:hypothetical protein